MKYMIGFKATFRNIFFVSLSVVLLAWVSVFLYGTIYYLYVPSVAHIRPVYFRFDKSCYGRECKFPTADILLPKKGYSKLLTRGQPYRIILDLEMPESNVNQKLGMFMVKLSIHSEKGRLLNSAFRSALFVYKSPMIQSIYTLLFSPFLLTGTLSEKQVLSVSLFENYEETHDEAAYKAIIEIHSLDIEIYSAALRVHADFSGLRYLMFYWPGLSATISILTIFHFLGLIALFSWLRFLRWCNENDLDPLPIEETIKKEKEDYFSPIPLSKHPKDGEEEKEGLSTTSSSSSETYKVLQQIGSQTASKKDISTTVNQENENSDFSNLTSASHARVFDIGNTLTMTPIMEEEGSVDNSPGSENEDTLELLLRKRK